MTADELENLWYGYGPTVGAIARQLIPHHPELWEDMVQEAWLGLLTSQGTPDTNPDAYYRMVMRNSMVDYIRRERPDTGVVCSFGAAKRHKRLACTACGSRNLAWTVFWPGLVRCRDCLALVELEDCMNGLTTDDVRQQYWARTRKPHAA